MTGLNVASRLSMKSSQIIDCALLSSLEASLHEVRLESEVLIVAAITDFLLTVGDCGTVTSSIDPVLVAFSSKVSNFCNTRPTL